MKNFKIGKYGNLRLRYLKEHKKAEYTILLMDNKLQKHLMDIDKTANERFELLIKQFSEKEKPDKNFYYVLKNLRGIATNVNQLARQANRYQYVDSNKFFAIADEISDFIIAIQETYLMPVRKD